MLINRAFIFLFKQIFKDRFLLMFFVNVWFSFFLTSNKRNAGLHEENEENEHMKFDNIIPFISITRNEKKNM